MDRCGLIAQQVRRDHGHEFDRKQLLRSPLLKHKFLGFEIS